MQKNIFTSWCMVLLLLGTNFLKAQNILQDTLNLSLSISIQGEFVDAELDNLNNLIVLEKTGRLAKYNDEGKYIADFNNFTKTGRPNAIDVSNPMKTLVWSQRNATLTILDRWFSQRNEIRLGEPGSNAVQAFGCSYDNNIWYFNPIDQQLKKIDDQNQLLVESNDMRSVIGESINPISLQDRDGWVMLLDTSKGIFLFDQFGVFKTKLMFKSQAAFIQNQVVCSINDNLLRENNLQTMQESFHWIALFPPTQGKIISVSKNNILLLKKEALHFFKIKN